MKLWIFGSSMCLPWKLDNPNQGWPALLADHLGITEIHNFSAEAVDNFFIYQSVLKRLTEITPDDFLIVGWSHPNRKTFVLDRDNPKHLAALKTSLHYVDGGTEIMRSNLPTPDSISKFNFLKPIESGLEFYDTWFKHYFNEYEQRINFQAFYDSVRLRAPCLYIPIHFTKESLTDIETLNTICYVDFVNQHQVQLSDNDYHLNVFGHKLFAQQLLQFTKK